MRHVHYCFVLLMLFAGSFTAANVAVAAPAPTFQISWDASQDLPLVDYGTHRLPMRLIALRAVGEIRIVMQQVTAARWDAALNRAEGAVPAASSALPSAPVNIITRGTQRGTEIVVVGVSPLFSRDGVTQRASKISASISGGVALDATDPFRTRGGAGVRAPAPYGPAQQQALKLSVSQAGVYQIGGIAMPAFSLSQLRLLRGATEVPLEIDDTDGDSVLSAADKLRFYAPPPGDRWNRTDTYWLSITGNTPPARITSRTLLAGTGTARPTAIETGTWHVPQRYDSRRAGPSGDHWFAGQLAASPELAPTAGITATITTLLPRSAGEATYTIAGAAVSSSTHLLRASAGAASVQMRWLGPGDWRKTVQLAADSSQLVLSLDQGTGIDSVQPDTISWQVPVTLRFGAAQASFVTPTSERYQLAGLPVDALVYDISDSNATQRLTLADRASIQAEAGHRYLVAPTSALVVPAIQMFTPPDLSAALNAQALYIAPAAWHAALAPLVALRQQQGYRVALIDPQAIYDTWSAGQVSPEAIRSLLRAAYVAGGGALIAATLVGDGSDDPFGYSRKPGPETVNNVNIIPPYLAPVDPWLSETACETCFGQLDGDSPLDDPLPDLMIGRISVKEAQQLSGIVDKIVRYETAPLDRETASRSFFIADNGREIDANGTITNDTAGDFAAVAERVIALQPGNMRPGRMYYDPTAPASDNAREPNSRRAYERTRALLDTGAALVTYIGHGGTYQWATTDLNNDPGVLLSLYDPDQMQNGPRTPLILEMTCLTSAFQVPNFYSTSIDERLLLKADGGAVATWGSSGEGVSLGHEALMHGFHTALWSAATTKTIGTLTQAGYLGLFTTAPDAQASLRTFLILGDPLTTMRVAPSYRTFLPLAVE